jgi:hypothetical protein
MAISLLLNRGAMLYLAMPIPTCDRKVPWAQAGDTGTLCTRHLTTDTESGDSVVLGDEAHIVSEERNELRFRPTLRNGVNSYANLLLLCPTDYKIVDEQVTRYMEQTRRGWGSLTIA